MIIKTKNNRQVLLRRLTPEDTDKLSEYLQGLSPDTKKRFGPHQFDKQSIIDIFQQSDKYIGYIAQDLETSEIVAYSVIQLGYLEDDSFRLRSYGLTLDCGTDCTFAPSVADKWQSQGIGKGLFKFMFSDLKKLGMKRIILWGGVQSDNIKAVNYYNQNGFRALGQFEHNGQNYDMILEIV
ncbi:MAG: GNAT family N-acetyltransferase [Lentimicrobiaceae bacterium]|jgi:GNAT superfamily N-acetyltransferase